MHSIIVTLPRLTLELKIFLTYLTFSKLSKVSDEATGEARQAEIKSLNLLILIISQFFDQKDLAD